MLFFETVQVKHLITLLRVILWEKCNRRGRYVAHEVFPFLKKWTKHGTEDFNCLPKIQ